MQAQSANKEALHVSKARLVNAQLAQSATRSDIDAHRAKVSQVLTEANPDYSKHVDVDESFSKTVGSDVVGGKA